MDDPFGFRRQHVGRALGRAFWLFEDQVLEGLRARGYRDFRMADAQVMRCLPARGGARLVDLAERARISKQGMSKQVAGMVARGYAERRPDPEDGRAQIIVLTRKGLVLLRAADAVILELERKWSALLGERNYARLKRDLFRLADAFGPEDYL